jgi:parallel beta-helix repeat protein
MYYLLPLISLVLILFINPLIGQQAYFVSSDGNDDQAGMLMDPWQTIQFGLDQLGPGDTLMIRGGVYEESCSLKVSGLKDFPVVVQAYQGEEVLLTGDIVDSEPTLSIRGQEHVIIGGLEFSGNEMSEGIYMDMCSNIVIEGCKIHGNKTGVHIENSDHLQPGRHLIVRNNFIYRNRGYALIVGPEDMEMASGLVDSLVVRNNSFFENDRGQEDRGEIQVTNCLYGRFVNNMFYLNEQALLGEVHEFFYELDFDYNAYYSILGEEAFQIYWNGVGVNGFNTFLSQTDEEKQGIFANPLFLSVAESNPDLHLTPNSPLIGRADPETGFAVDERDIDGQTRVNDLPDIGADEYHLQIVICALGIFEATSESDHVRLNWSGTCFSESGGRYLVQRSRERNDWETIAEVQSDIAKFNTEVFYEYFDEDPLIGLSFYRTRFVDENGSYLDSNVDEVGYSGGEVLVYPNPVKDLLHIISNKKYEIKKIRIYDLAGKLVRAEEFKDQLYTRDLPAGKYFIEFLDGRLEIIDSIHLLRY